MLEALQVHSLHYGPPPTPTPTPTPFLGDEGQAIFQNFYGTFGGSDFFQVGLKNSLYKK